MNLIILFVNKNWLNIPNNIVTECHMKLMLYISTLQVFKELSNDTTKCEYMQFFAANYKWQALMAVILKWKVKLLTISDFIGLFERYTEAEFYDIYQVCLGLKALRNKGRAL